MVRRAVNKSFLGRAANKIPSWARRASAVIGPIGAIAALIIGIRDLGNLSGPGWAEVLAWAGVALVVVAIATIYLEQYRHEVELGDYLRNAQVAVALPVLHEAFHTLRDASYSIREGDSEEMQLTLLVKSLDHVAIAFSSITGAPCRMCVKLLIAADDAPGEVTLSEDANNADERWFNVKTLYRHDGSHDPAKDQPTPLYRNSDFRQVWDQKHNARCFFSNDLDAEPNYVNDHRAGNANDFEYNSTIVWPIQKKKLSGNVDLIGYLCVDSLQKNAFQYNNDFYLGAAYADSLYMVLAMRRPQTPQREL